MSSSHEMKPPVPPHPRLPNGGAWDSVHGDHSIRDGVAGQIGAGTQQFLHLGCRQNRVAGAHGQDGHQGLAQGLGSGGDV